MEVVVIETRSKLNINVRAKNNDIVLAVQKDRRTRYLDITLIDGSTPVNLSGATVRLFARKPSGSEVYNNAVVKSSSGGRVEVEMTNQLLAEIGVITAQIVISRSTNQLTSLPFQIHVVENLLNTSTVESTNEYGSLVVLFQDLEQAKLQMQQIISGLGTPNGKTQQLGINSMYSAFNYIINYLETNSVANIVSDIRAIKSKSDLLTHSSYGLSAIKNYISSAPKDMLGRQIKQATFTYTKRSGATPTEIRAFTFSKPVILVAVAESKVNYGSGTTDVKFSVKGSGNFEYEANSSTIFANNLTSKIFPMALTNGRIDITNKFSSSGPNYTSSTLNYSIVIYYYELE